MQHFIASLFRQDLDDNIDGVHSKAVRSTTRFTKKLYYISFSFSVRFTFFTRHKPHRCKYTNAVIHNLIFIGFVPTLVQDIAVMVRKRVSSSRIHIVARRSWTAWISAGSFEKILGFRVRFSMILCIRLCEINRRFLIARQPENRSRTREETISGYFICAAMVAYWIFDRVTNDVRGE